MVQTEREQMMNKEEIESKIEEIKLQEANLKQEREILYAELNKEAIEESSKYIGRYFKYVHDDYSSPELNIYKVNQVDYHNRMNVSTFDCEMHETSSYSTYSYDKNSVYLHQLKSFTEITEQEFNKLKVGIQQFIDDADQLDIRRTKFVESTKG